MPPRRIARTRCVILPDCAVAHIVEERKKIIETEILSQYDIGSYEEYRNLKHTEANLFEAITKEIKAAEENWFLLFCGFF